MDNVTTTSGRGTGISISKGILYILLGLAALIWPEFTIGFVLVLFALFVMVAGFMAIVGGLFNIGKGWGWLVSIILGVLAVILGFVVLFNPGVSAVTYIWLLGAYLIVAGIVIMVSGDESTSQGMRIVEGVSSVIMGILLVLYPVSSGAVFYWILAIYAIIAGIIMIFTAMRYRRELREHAQTAGF